MTIATPMMARGLAGIPGIRIARLKERGVLINPVGATWMRLVTHHDVNREGCEMALAALAEVAAGVGSVAGLRDLVSSPGYGCSFSVAFPAGPS
jgi:hypothetical protein